jgi:glycosyltransferase involved in cell wall biosynthesis
MSVTNEVGGQGCLRSQARLAFVSHMVGRHPGYVPTQGQILSDLFQEAGYAVIAVSAQLSRARRLTEIVSTLSRRRRELDLLIIDVYGGPSFIAEDAASLLGRLFGKRIVMLLHGGALPEFMARFPQWSRRVLQRADQIVTPSTFLARAIAQYGFQAQIIPNVIELSDYPYQRRREIKPSLFWMRSFHPLYNPLLAVRVLARLRECGIDADLVLAGADKGYENAVRKEAASLQLKGAVRFAGFLDRAGKAREGARAGLFLNTSSVDNMPVALLEACAMGLPVVTTAVGGIPDLLTDGETGLLVPDNDEAALAAAIVRLLNEPSLAERLSINGRRLAERSAWEQVRPQWERVFSELQAQQKKTIPEVTQSSTKKHESLLKSLWVKKTFQHQGTKEQRFKEISSDL